MNREVVKIKWTKHSIEQGIRKLLLNTRYTKEEGKNETKRGRERGNRRKRNRNKEKDSGRAGRKALNSGNIFAYINSSLYSRSFNYNFNVCPWTLITSTEIQQNWIAPPKRSYSDYIKKASIFARNFEWNLTSSWDASRSKISNTNLN